MSMRSYPSKGYIVKLDTPEMRQAMPGLDNALNNYYCDRDLELLNDWVSKNMPKSWPNYDDLYMPSDEDDISDNMERGVVYVAYDESDLYTKQPTPSNQVLNMNGIIPTSASWSVYG